MKHPPRILRMALTALLVAGTVPVAATTASAAACDVSTGRSFASDYAWTTDLNGGCGTVSVRHSFNPAGTVTVWTPWDYDANHARSARNAELRSSQHNW